MARFKELKTHLEALQHNKRIEIAFRIFFQEEYEPFRMKITIIWINYNDTLKASIFIFVIQTLALMYSEHRSRNFLTQKSLVVIESGGTKSENSSLETTSSSSGNDADADIDPLYDSDTVTRVPHLNNDTFENMFTHGIQIHEQPESILDTYEANENNSNIISDKPNMDPDRDKE
uniref:Uncharacterized protein n=1 Tax=Tanacetum cinerariifolium TaxID=118510 RepID=A0A699GMP1_TANCI|nr:hypothetical protein [Tanacetum cinerariifolium]